nr:DUF4197 domain-containing protein [Deltaproteobacteria bacterium]
MNRAAEKASEEALPILVQAVKDLSFEDARSLWKGGGTSATDYFQDKTWQPLSERLRPIVHDTSQTVGVTQAYQSLVDYPAVKPIVAGTDLDVDHYVTAKTLDGLFTFRCRSHANSLPAVPCRRLCGGRRSQRDG